MKVYMYVVHAGPFIQDIYLIEFSAENALKTVEEYAPPGIWHLAGLPASREECAKALQAKENMLSHVGYKHNVANFTDDPAKDHAWISVSKIQATPYNFPYL